MDFFYLIVIHSMQGSSHYEAWSYKKKHEHTGHLFRKNLQLKDVR